METTEYIKRPTQGLRLAAVMQFSAHSADNQASIQPILRGGTPILLDSNC